MKLLIKILILIMLTTQAVYSYWNKNSWFNLINSYNNIAKPLNIYNQK
jgi:hypothetical protein